MDSKQHQKRKRANKKAGRVIMDPIFEIFNRVKSQRQSVASERKAMAIDMKQAATTPGQP